jgi:hypothetical protein
MQIGDDIRTFYPNGHFVDGSTYRGVCWIPP